MTKFSSAYGVRAKAWTPLTPGVGVQELLWSRRRYDLVVALPQATCALYEVLSAPSSGAVVLELFPQLFVALLLRVSCTVGVQLPRNLQAKERKSTSPARAARNLDPCRYWYPDFLVGLNLYCPAL